MKKKYWVILAVTVVVLAALLLPACAKPAPTPTPTPSTRPTPAPAPTPAPTPKPTPAPTPTPTPAPTLAPPAAPKTIKLSYTTPKGKGYSGGLEWFGPEFEKRTNGRYKVEIYPTSVLFSQRVGMDAVKSRIAEIGVFSASMFSTAFPLFIGMALPTGVEISTEKDWYAAWDMSWEYYNMFPEVQAECKDFKLLIPYYDSPGISCTQE